MTPSIDAVIIGLLVINLIGLLVVGARSTGQSSGQSNDQRKDATELDKRLTRLEARVDNLPTHRDLVDLRAGINEMARTVAGVAGQVQTVTDMLRTIQEHLLENDR